MRKINFFNVNWIFKDKKLQQSHHLKLLKLYIYIESFNALHY
jgi:hypothetical protein